MSKLIAEDIKKRIRLPGNRFPATLHCTRQGDPPHEIWDFSQGEPRPGWIYLGWCPSGATGKPGSGWPGMDHHVAVLLGNSAEEEVWLHVPVSREMLGAI